MTAEGSLDISVELVLAVKFNGDLIRASRALISELETFVHL